MLASRIFFVDTVNYRINKEIELHSGQLVYSEISVHN